MGHVDVEKIVVNPETIKALGDEGGELFCLVTNSRYVDAFEIAASPRYRGTRVIAFDDGQDFPDIMRREIPEGSHIVTILPDCLLYSIPRETLGRRKLLIMACRSGRTSLEGVAHFLRVGERTEPDEQVAFAERFFERGQMADHLDLVNEEYGTSARFSHLNDIYEWHEQLGPVDWGDQQVYPAGEIACFLVPLYIEQLKPEVAFDISGQFALKGETIVQSGPPSFLPEDQERIYNRLATMRDRAVIIDVENGDVTGVAATDTACKPAADMLQALFDVDSRYRRLYEVGFSINQRMELWPGNTAMNEVYGGANGTLHLGLGMLPHTQYHLDIFCAGTKVLGKDGEVIFGGAGKKTMRRKKSAACPCTVY